MSRAFRMPDFLAGKEPPRVEGVIASLIDLGASRDQIEILPAGTFRAYRGHLIDLLPPPGAEVASGGQIRLYVAEHGIADRLPDGFMKPLSTDLNPDTLFDQIPSRRVWRGGRSGDSAPDPEEAYGRGLDGGRALLRVLDASLRRVRRDMTLLPQRLEAGGIDEAATGWFLRRLGLEDSGLDDQGRRFIALHLPGLSRAVGRGDEASALLTRLLGRPVRITESHSLRRLGIPPEIRARTGKSRLGMDACVGEEFTDPEGTLRVSIGPVPAKEREAMLRDSHEMDRLRRIVDMFMPAGRNAVVELAAGKGEDVAMLGRHVGGLLGETSRLNDRVAAVRLDAAPDTPAPMPKKAGPVKPPPVQGADKEPVAQEPPPPPPDERRVDAEPAAQEPPPPKPSRSQDGGGGIRSRRIRIDDEE